MSSLKKNKQDRNSLASDNVSSPEKRKSNSKCESDGTKEGSSEQLCHGNDGMLPPEMCNPHFPWNDYKHTLNKIFFCDKDLIQRGTKDYDDFWSFLKKYQMIQQKARKKSSNSKTDTSRKIFTIDPTVMTDMLMRGHLFKDDRRSDLTEKRLTEFQYIINLYIDFKKKEKVAKLLKLKEAQENLPIYKHKDKIIAAVKNHQVVIVAGDTGCGKSTQVPQYLVGAGYESIACTQPRRIACISLCNRVSYETQNEYGSEIGYQIRFEKSKTSNTKILFLTEGLLLRQVSSDPMLSNYNVIILDEVHERHLPCDFLLGLMKCLAIQRPDVKIVLMSATINIQLFAEYFNGCPVIQVPGRLFPIEVNNCPISAEDQKTLSGRLNPAPYIRIMNLINHKYSDDEKGDLLIFLSGMTEISIVEEAARAYAEKTNKWIVLPLHSTLSLEQQDKVFDIVPESVRKCIISTNIAETSVTIDGIRFVVDSGKVKEMSYDPNCHLQRLQEFWISKASAEQRKGRAGRTGPGVCFRLYSETEYDAMSPFAKPEIQRVSLDSLLLHMISLGLPNARKFPFLEAPAMDSIEKALQSLMDQGALDSTEAMTPMGQMLSRLPVEVAIGKMLILGSIFSFVEPALSLAAALSVQSPFTNRTTRDAEIREARQTLDSDHGDPLTLLNAYHKWLEVKAGRNNSRQWCRRYGLEEQRFYEMSKLRRQFKDLLRDAGLLPDEERLTSTYDRSSRHGELRHLKDIKRKYQQTPRGRKILKLANNLDGHADGEEDDDDRKIDIKDVEFQMSHDRRQVHELSSSSQVRSYQDVMCLKVIVCSGLYPRLALADVHNTFKSHPDQYFHTKRKHFTVVHPNSVFALQPDLLSLSTSDCVDVAGFKARTPVSTKHQLLVYMSLLETSKPYLVNCLRVPAAHMLLLLSRSVDTNEDFTRIICDEWLELRFPECSSMQKFVSKVMVIRDSWQTLLKNAFEELSLEKDRKLDTIRKMGRDLLYSINQFFRMEMAYSIRRLLAADVKNLYVTQFAGIPKSISIMEDVSDCKKNPVKGGLQIKDYLTHNCLVDEEMRSLHYLHKVWVCPHCNKQMIITVIDQVRHLESCREKNEDTEKSDNPSDRTQTDSLRKPYHCDTCQLTLYLTVTEVLKHKKTHVAESS